MATEIYLTQIFYPFFFGSKEISLTILFSVVQPRRTSKKEKKKKKSYFHHFTLHQEKHITATLSLLHFKGNNITKKIQHSENQNPSNNF